MTGKRRIVHARQRLRRVASMAATLMALAGCSAMVPPAEVHERCLVYCRKNAGYTADSACGCGAPNVTGPVVTLRDVPVDFAEAGLAVMNASGSALSTLCSTECLRARGLAEWRVCRGECGMLALSLRIQRGPGPVPAVATSEVARVQSGTGARARIPASKKGLPSGGARVVLDNPNEFVVFVALRDGDAGAEIEIPPRSKREISLAAGPMQYGVYTVFGNTPDHLRHDPKSRLSFPQAGTMTISFKYTLPALRRILAGPSEVRLRNPTGFSVTAAIRDGDGGNDIEVPANSTGSAFLPAGRYEIYFVYSNDPAGLYQGDTFTLANAGVQIDLVQSPSGNYGVRRVR
jgi:hypothetical protein